MASALRVRDRRSSRGIAWLAGGWSLFKGRPIAWIAMGTGWMAITLGLLVVPLVGGVVANLLQPVFFASFALAAAKQAAGGPVEVGDLFAGFQRPLKPLINLGAILLVAEIGIFALLALLGLPGLETKEGQGPNLAEFARQLQGREWILVVGVALTAVVKGALWFAPALLAFHELTTAHALRWSVYAALSNLGAMLVYGVALTLAFAVGILPWGLGLLVVIPVMLASTWAGYADVFEDEGEGEGETPTPA